jgi:two-component system cell cycle sensor histidine kinase/response regulator CckA
LPPTPGRGKMSPMSRSPLLFDDALARIAFDLSPSGMLAVNEQGEIVAVNREVEHLFGWPREELIGRSIDVLVPERFRRRHTGHRATFMHDPQTRAMGAGRDLFGLRRDGAEFPVEIGLKPVKSGEHTVVLASIVDITARRALEDRQRRSQKLEAIGVLAGGIAHDFNNILLSIVGHTELALRDPGLNDQSKGDLDRVLKGAQRGRDLVKRILLFSRDSEVVKAPVRLERTATEALNLMRASLPSSVEIRTRFDPATPVVLSDETQIHQILVNLATNSLHAMPNGGTLTITIEPFRIMPEYAAAHPGLEPGRAARITVSDTGTGMPPAVLERALEPFFTTKPPGQGTGLGLSVIHGIVRSHRGTLEIASVEGRGTTIAIVLPQGGDAGIESLAGEESPKDEKRGPHVLFVEDEPVLADMQKRQLEHMGFTVTTHTSSVQALADFRQRPDAFAIVITDDTMPQMRGLVLAREIHAIRPALPILMVSGGDNAQPQDLEAAGVRKVLRKPHTASELEQAIREVLQ